MFLDEVAEVLASVQAKLLVAIERREVRRLGSLKARPIDVRFVSATNKSREEQAIASFYCGVNDTAETATQLCR